jgi:hypothetical protein
MICAVQLDCGHDRRFGIVRVPHLSAGHGGNVVRAWRLVDAAGVLFFAVVTVFARVDLPDPPVA